MYHILVHLYSSAGWACIRALCVEYAYRLITCMSLSCSMWDVGCMSKVAVGHLKTMKPFIYVGKEATEVYMHLCWV